MDGRLHHRLQHHLLRSGGAAGSSRRRHLAGAGGGRGQQRRRSAEPGPSTGGRVMDAELIDPTRDRVWAVDVTVIFTSYVVAETREDAERIAENEAGDV